MINSPSAGRWDRQGDRPRLHVVPQSRPERRHVGRVDGQLTGVDHRTGIHRGDQIGRDPAPGPEPGHSYRVADLTHRIEGNDSFDQAPSDPRAHGETPVQRAVADADIGDAVTTNGGDRHHRRNRWQLELS